MADEETSAQKPSKGFLTKKVGPFPVVVWVVIGASLVGIYLYVRQRNSANTTPGAVGQQSGQGAGVGVNTADPLTTEQLLGALNNLGVAVDNLRPPVLSQHGAGALDSISSILLRGPGANPSGAGSDSRNGALPLYALVASPTPPTTGHRHHHGGEGGDHRNINTSSVGAGSSVVAQIVGWVPFNSVLSATGAPELASLTSGSTTARRHHGEGGARQAPTGQGGFGTFIPVDFGGQHGFVSIADVSQYNPQVISSTPSESIFPNSTNGSGNTIGFLNGPFG